MRKIFLVLFLAGSLFGESCPLANRVAAVDAEGILRWQDNGGEVALMGVNYYPPFCIDYDQLVKRGIDPKLAMRQDVEHFKRLGLGCLRLHCFDREFSTPVGAFVDNRHVELLDDLIALCAANDIYLVLTPIAWWNDGTAKPTDGFSDHFPMHQMTTDRRAWQVQARFLKAFAEHVNRYTGKRYADDPAILAFECINEPLYPKGTTDATVTEYINTLVDALRSSGTKKPIYYNSWQGRNAAAGVSRVDGVTCAYYSPFATTVHEFASIRASTLHPDASIAKKSRMVYEFDTPHNSASCLYPAMAKVFRAEGVQVAAQFQYDPMVLSDVNNNWRMHYLNLIYTPQKALSLAIAAQVFRLVPRGGVYTPANGELSFPPFFLSSTNDLSECVTDALYLYTNNPRTPPKNPSALERVWGCGNSTVAAWPGSGAYFLDRVSRGVWRLQIYPDVLITLNPYSGTDQKKALVLVRAHEMAVNLPDLGGAFTVWPLAAGKPLVKARAGKFDTLPGDFLLTRGEELPGESILRQAHRIAPAYVVPAASTNGTPKVFIRIPSQWRANRPMPLAVSSAFTDSITFFSRPLYLGAMDAGKDRSKLFSTAEKNIALPGEFFKEGNCGVSFVAGNKEANVSFPDYDDATGWSAAKNTTACPLFAGMERKTVFQLMGNKGMTCGARWTDEGLSLDYSSVTQKEASAGCIIPFETAKVPLPHSTYFGLHVAAKNLSGNIARLEIGLRLASGHGLACNVTLTPGENDFVVPPDAFFPAWNLPDRNAFRWEDVRHVTFLSGSWLWWLSERDAVPRQRVLFRRLECVATEPAFGVAVHRNARDWNFFRLEETRYPTIWSPLATKRQTFDEQSRPALYVHVKAFTKSAHIVGFRIPCDTGDFFSLFPDDKPKTALVFHARACLPQTTALEFVLIEDDGTPWGTNLPLTQDWRDIHVPLNQLHHFKHWQDVPPLAPGRVPDFRLAQSFNFNCGSWLFQKSANLPHAFEISALHVE